MKPALSFVLSICLSLVLFTSPARADDTSCDLGDHPGIDDAEARTGADLVCHELARQGARGPHEVRFGRLGGKTLVVVASRADGADDDRRAFLGGLGELPLAAPRLVAALVEHKPFEDTKSVDNILSAETQSPRVQGGSMGMDGALFGMTGMGEASGGAGGVALGLVYRAEHFAVSSTGRAGGIGNGDAKIGTASLDFGARYYLESTDFSPFVGGGFVVGYFKLNRKTDVDLDGSGIGAYAHAGLELFRTHHTAFSIAGRVDAPFFTLRSPSGPQSYVLPISLNVGILFH